MLDTDAQFTANSDAKVPSQKAVKTYVDSLALNLGKRGRVRAATTANITISTALNNADTLDGVTLATGDLVLVKNQSTASENGVYVVGVSPARASEYDSWAEFPGSLIAVAEGTTNADTLWLCTSNDGGTLGSSSIAFSKMVIAGELLASDIGVTVQAYDAQLAALAVLSPSNGQFTRWTGSTTAVSQSIVGTVSQSSNIPTGAIVERGSNANGEYVRYADGTQICWGTVAYSGDVNNGFAGVYRSATSDMNITFPAAFSATPVVTGSVPVSLTSSQTLFGVTIRSPSSTGVILLVLRGATQTGVSADVYWQAVGRWF